MERLNFAKVVQVSALITEITNLEVNDQLTYYHTHAGSGARGVIQLKGHYRTPSGTGEFVDQIEVDLFIPLEHLLDKQGLHLVLSDFQHQIKDDEVLITLTMDIVGLKAGEVNFIPTDDYAITEETPVVIESEIEPEMVIENLARALGTTQQELTLMPYLDPVVRILTALDQLEPSSEAPIPIDVKKDAAPAEVVLGTPAPEELANSPMPEALAPDKQEGKEAAAIPVPVVNAQTTTFSLFKDSDTSLVHWQFHAVGDGDTYPLIALRYGIDVAVLQALNHDEELYLGKLVCLP